MADTKICRKCGAEKPLGDFHRRRATRDGLYSYCKPCAIADAKAWASRPARKEVKRAYDKARVARLKDRLQTQYRANYLINRDTKIANAAAWAEANREKRRLISQSYKHRRRSSERAGMSGKELREWRSAQPESCHWCGSAHADSYVVDHVIPLAKGGKHEAGNLVIACRSCNARKAARDPEEFAREVCRSTAAPEMLEAA